MVAVVLARMVLRFIRIVAASRSEQCAGNEEHFQSFIPQNKKQRVKHQR
jgi:hypothetical protein